MRELTNTVSSWPYPSAGVAGTGNTFFVSHSWPLAEIDYSGNIIRQFGIEGATDLELGSDDLLYSNGGTIRVYDMTGGVVRSFLTGDCGQGISVSTDGLIYAACESSVKVFGPTGALLRTWGEPGNLYGQFEDLRDVVVRGDGVVLTLERNGRVQFFTSEGIFLRARTAPFWGARMKEADDGLIWIAHGDYGVGVYDAEIESVYRLGGSERPIYGSRVLFRTGSQDAGPLSGPPWCAVSTDGQYLLLPGCTNEGGTLFSPYISLGLAKRVYRSARHADFGGVPVPVMLSSTQRPGTTHVDIDFQVIDPDSPTVTVGVIGFRDSESLGQVVRLQTFTENTDTNLGAGVAANTPHRITWDAGADWATNFGSVAINLLANDGRGLLDFHFITLPPSGTNPALTIERSPIPDTDLFPLWCWLLATNDPAILLISNRLYGTAGPYASQVLAQDATTLPMGRTFLYERLQVRQATTAEIARASAAAAAGMLGGWEGGTVVPLP